MAIQVVLLDLDGVVRHFDPAHVASVESKHGLAPGALSYAAFAAELLEPVITGKVRRSEWVEQVGEAVGNERAAQEWMSERGYVDEKMMDAVAQLRMQGITVAVLTNGTDTIPEEMVELGLVDRFDAIFSTADIGYSKPDLRAFEHVCEKLAVDPTTVFFTDDSVSKLAGATELGIDARLFEGLAMFQRHLADHNIAVSI